VNQPHIYCTYFDSGYLTRGLALIESLRQHGDDSPVWVLALDDAAKKYLDEAALPGVHTLAFADIESANPALSPLKTSRSRMEYVFTSTPLLLRWVMDKHADANAVVIYLDADMYFFDDPELVLDAMADDSIGIIEHRYPPRLAKRLSKYGRFNVGWVGFRADARGRACLDWWAQSTLEWCFDTPTDGKYADQGYLDSFPTKFPGVAILQPLGLDLAPWNSMRFTLLLTAKGTVTVDGDPLVFFHFHGLRQTGEWYVTSHLVYGSRLGAVLRNQIYRPYVEKLEALTATVSASSVSTAKVIAPRGRGLRGLAFRVQKAMVTFVSIATGSAIRVRHTAK
jgi:hypothetical protein